ncbi:MAG: GGDEF domain-containing protein [Pseudomonadales bacterium]
MNISNADFHQLLDNYGSTILILDANNTPIYNNASYHQFDQSFKDKLLTCHSDCYLEGYNIRCLALSEGRALYIDSPVARPNHSEGLLGRMLQRINYSDELFDSTVEAIAEITGWRWIFITRFLDESTVEVLSFWNTYRHEPGSNYTLPDSPCEAMVRNKKFTLFTDVAVSFAKNEFLTQLGAVSYAGLVYYGREQEPIGHIMCMHDTSDVDYKYMEDVIKLASLAVSSRLLLTHTQSALESAVDLANTDTLTKLNNRKVFEQMCGQAAKAFREEGVDSSIGIIDLNNFKLYNDRFGHPKGDVLLRLFATELTKLGRVSDNVFRLGGDEFALVLPKATIESTLRIRNQLSDIEQRITMMLDHRVTASIGFASLSESEGDCQRCYATADKRMYQNKAEQKRGQS